MLRGFSHYTRNWPRFVATAQASEKPGASGMTLRVNTGIKPYKLAMGEPMTRAELLQTFRSTASEISEKDFSKVDESGVISDLGIDSLELLEVIGSLERDLNIRVPDDQLVGIQTVGQLLNLVAVKLPQAD